MFVAFLATLTVSAGAAGAQTPTLVVEYYHVDPLNSVRAVTDELGSVIQRRDYAPFGEEIPSQQIGARRLEFTGKERDTTTGLDYFGARYYASQIGRFTTVDPGHVGGDIFNPQSWNGYAYALNNPQRFVDPLGTCSQDSKGNFTDDDPKGSTFVSKGACPKNEAGGLSIGFTQTVSVQSKPAIVSLAEGIKIGAGPVADPRFIGGFYGASAAGGLAVAGAIAGVGAEAITLGVARLAPLTPLAGQLKFTDTVLRHMSNPGRMVPIQTLADAIESGTRMADPQGAAGAVKIVQQVIVNGTPRTLEIIYREADKTILHFLYK